MSIVPKIRNKPPKMDGGQWVYWQTVSPAGRFEEVSLWRHGWREAKRLEIIDVLPHTNVSELMWFCTDMDWYRMQYQLQQMRLMQALGNQMTGNCSCNHNPYRTGGGLFGGLFGPW